MWVKLEKSAGAVELASSIFNIAEMFESSRIIAKYWITFEKVETFYYLLPFSNHNKKNCKLI